LFLPKRPLPPLLLYTYRNYIDRLRAIENKESQRREILFYHIDPVSVWGVVVATAAMERGREQLNMTHNQMEKKKK
jgi:hypothetical protein